MPYSNISFTINTGLSFEVNDFVKLVHDASTAIYGRVVSYNPSTGALVLTPYSFSGSGSYNTWAVDLTGVSGTSGVSATSGTSGISSTSGNNGTNGTSGVSGSSGTSGESAIGIADSGTSTTCLTFPLPVTSTTGFIGISAAGTGVTFSACYVNGYPVTWYSGGSNFPFNNDNETFTTLQLGTNQTIRIDVSVFPSGQHVTLTDSDSNVTCIALGSSGDYYFTGVVIDGVTPVSIVQGDGSC